MQPYLNKLAAEPVDLFAQIAAAAAAPPPTPSCSAGCFGRTLARSRLPGGPRSAPSQTNASR
jgi:hypothetical protein